MNRIEMIQSLECAVLRGGLEERGRGIAHDNFTKTLEILRSETGLKDGIKTDDGKRVL